MAEYISFQPSDHFSTTLYSTTGSSLAVTGVGFAPDFTWLKLRTSAQVHCLTDSVRGATKYIKTDGTTAETTNVQTLTGFDSDGFTVGTDDIVNKTGNTAVSWNWKAGTTSGIATNGSTTITPSAYSFNQTSGFSIIQYTGNGVSGAKIAHGLGATPNMIIVKKTSSTADWCMYHQRIDSTAPEDYNIKLNSGLARSNNSSFWYDTVPDSVNFTIGDSGDLNSDTTTNIAYSFAEKQGYSKFGSYKGNGNADGPFVYTGFRPAFLILKDSSAAGDDWKMHNNKSNLSNSVNKQFQPNNNSSEYTSSSAGYYLDFLSNGFKIRGVTHSAHNANGDTYIYAVFAEFPLVSSNDIPVVAR